MANTKHQGGRGGNTSTAPRQRANVRNNTSGRGGRRNQPEQSKAELIRTFHNRNMDTGQIISELEGMGFKVHYSEVYGAIERGEHDGDDRSRNHGPNDGRSSTRNRR